MHVLICLYTLPKADYITVLGALNEVPAATILCVQNLLWHKPFQMGNVSFYVFLSWNHRCELLDCGVHLWTALLAALQTCSTASLNSARFSLLIARLLPNRCVPAAKASLLYSCVSTAAVSVESLSSQPKHCYSVVPDKQTKR